jgi:hypothetical protein
MSVPTVLPIVVFLVALVALGMASMAWGSDTRSFLSNDHNR